MTSPKTPQQTRLYEQLRELALHDSTVYAYLSTQQSTDALDLEVAIALIKQLAKEKKAYLDDAIQTRNMAITPIVLPKVGEHDF